MDIHKQSLPKKYKKNDKWCYLDPIRKRLSYITPEETVRQKILKYLVEELNIPATMIRVEEALSHYEKGLTGRADIIVHRNTNERIQPLLVIECKAPNVMIGEKETRQVINYADQLLCDFVTISNGVTSYSYQFDEKEKRYIEINEIPKYEDLIKGNVSVTKIDPLPNRVPHKEIEKFIIDSRKYKEYINIGYHTPLSLAIPIFNFWECLLDTRFMITPKDYTIFSLKEDLGVRLLNYGNASGGVFSGPYRSFLIEMNGENQIVSIAVSECVSNARPNIEKTTINVAIDTDKAAHHSLQLVVDHNVKVINNELKVYHNGRIAIGNIGSGKIGELKELVASIYPDILSDDKFFLGTFSIDKLCLLHDDEVQKLIENLISYALIRDMYRKKVKNSN